MDGGTIQPDNSKEGGGLMEIKTDWQAKDGLTDSDLSRIEANILDIRAEPTLPLVVEVLSSYPSHAKGRVFYHTGDKRTYTSTGTAWV